jgi:hypothetical protein
MEQRSEAPYPVHSGEAFKTTELQSPRISFMGGFLTYRTHRLTELYMASQRNGTMVRRVSDFCFTMTCLSRIQPLQIPSNKD